MLPPAHTLACASKHAGCQLNLATCHPHHPYHHHNRHDQHTNQQQDLPTHKPTAGPTSLHRRYNQREGRTLLEVLQDFKSAQPPLEWLLTAAPLLKPRLFSISSGPALQPGRVHITAAVVTWSTPFKRTKLGLCSSWLAGLLPAAGAAAAGDGSSASAAAETTAETTADAAADSRAAAGSRVPVWIERGSLRMPADPQVPLLLVGPGTGVAPFRAFLQERLAAARQAAAAEQPPPAPCHLFFGCRSRAADFYYEPEWQALQEAGVLASEAGLVVAFSRDQGSKVYVQHKIREHAGMVWALLQGGALVYVCGSADKMPADVAAAFRDVVVAQGGLGREEADKYVRRLQLTGRYHVEAWS
jgi:sulfite reductase alpha subunit-like flavoprotein